MKSTLILVGFLLSAACLRADDDIKSVQQALKDQGFYYGEITGEKNADTTAAIRRFQIRNGLQITGDLNDETQRAIRNNATVSSPPAAAAVPAPAPSRPADTSDLRDASSQPSRPVPVTPNEPENVAPVNPPEPPEQDAPVAGPGYGMFAGTPYEQAPPEVQRNVIASAQKSLAHQNLYRGAINGMYGSNMEFSLRAYQARIGLPTTGRLDIETLAALELLPGAHAPIFNPRRIPREPVVRGEWVRP